MTDFEKFEQVIDKWFAKDDVDGWERTESSFRSPKSSFRRMAPRLLRAKLWPRRAV